MDISRFVPNLGNTQDDLTEEELDALDEEANRRRLANVPKHGPRKTRWLTGGQVRRQAERDAAREKRKANLTYRHRWMDQQQALANLRGQLEVLHRRSPMLPLTRNALQGVVVKFGEDPESETFVEDAVSKAREAYLAATK